MFLESLYARFGPDLIDVIKAIPDRNGTGTLAISTEIAALESIRVPGVDLVTFAKRHFGTGTLRKIGDDLYAVLRGTPSPVQPVRKLAPVFPTWVFHV
jgi:hypothetical protein